MKKRSKIIIVSVSIILLIILICVIWAYKGPCDWISRLEFEAPSVISYPYMLPISRNNEKFLPFAVVGDTQRTSFWECAIGREVNDDETAVIVKEIASSKVNFLVILGDMVFDGGNKRHWEFFDRTIMPLRHAALPILPVAGNHEYWGDRAAARKFVEERFPEIRKRTWYSKRNGNLGLVWLNSNHKEMSQNMWKTQVKWLKTLLSQWDLTEDVKGIILFAHHPPYTNSIVASSDLKVRTALVEVLCQSQKAVAMVTGHAHGYERFENLGEPQSCSKQVYFNTSQNNEKISDILNHPVQFIVSGGGGGPRPKGLRNKYKDSFTSNPPRPFNFIRVEPSENGVKMSIHGLQKGETQTHVLEQFIITYHK